MNKETLNRLVIFQCHKELIRRLKHLVITYKEPLARKSTMGLLSITVDIEKELPLYFANCETLIDKDNLISCLQIMECQLYSIEHDWERYKKDRPLGREPLNDHVKIY